MKNKNQLKKLTTNFQYLCKILFTLHALLSKSVTQKKKNKIWKLIG